MPIRPANPNDPVAFWNDIRRRVEDLERRSPGLPLSDGPLQTFEDGSPLGDTRFLDFGAGVNATLIGEDYVMVEGAGAGTRWGTVVVAASDTHQAGKDQADFVCTGVADQTTLDLALDAAPSGGEIVLLEGNYNLTGVWLIDVPNIHVRGMGMATIINFNASSTFGIQVGTGFIAATNVRLSNFHFKRTGGSSVEAIRVASDISDDFQMQWVFVEGTFSVGCTLFGTRWRVENCRFLNNDVAIQSAGSESAFGVIQNNIVVGGTTGIITFQSRVAIIGNVLSTQTSGGISANGLFVTIAGNVCDASGSSPINVSATDCVISSNVVRGSGAGTGINVNSARTSVTGNRVEAVTGDGIQLSNDCTCVGNVIRSASNAGIVAGVGFGARSTIIGNTVSLCGKEGVSTAGDDATIQGNTVYQCSQSVDNLYDGILVTGDRNDVQGNTVRQGGGTNDHRYGIHISGATSNDNLVCNNDLFDSAQTAPFNDTGTGTRACTDGGLPGGGVTGAPASADYLVGTANAGLSAEIVVGPTPGGELDGTWAAPTVDATHSGSSHAGVVTTHEGAADPHTVYQRESEKNAASGYPGLNAGGGLTGIGNDAAASTPGTVVKKMEVFDEAGASLGFLAVYDAIT